MLIESQENIFQMISAELSQSSHSTNVGELEETLLLAMGTRNHTNDIEIEEDETSKNSTYNLRTRTVVKESRKKLLRAQSCASKSPKTNSNSLSGNWSCDKFFNIDCPTLLNAENVETEDNSQESVSMLQECYRKKPKNEFPELMETCTHSELEVIDIYSDEEIEDLDVGKANEKDESKLIQSPARLENSTQTDFPILQIMHSKEREVVKHANFIGCIVKLKAALSSKKTNSDINLWSTVYRSMKSGKVTSENEVSCQIDEQKLCQSGPKETIGYLLRSSDVENVFHETVKALLQHLEDAIKDDFFKTASFWKDSVYEKAVEMLNEAVDNEIGVWKMVDLFLCRTIKSVLKDGGDSKNLILESKANLIISFCHSTHLSCTANGYIIRKLEKLKLIKRTSETSFQEKLFWTNLTKGSYFLLRILESSLELLISKMGGGKFEDVVKKPERKNYNVLEMWKKRWNQNEKQKEEKTEQEWETKMNDWCRKLDEILLHCVSHVPILSMAVERCGELAKKILKMCHPEMTEDRIDKSI